MESGTKTDIRTVLVERGAKHGDYTEQARITQNLKAMARNSVNWKEAQLSAVETDAIEMILVKLGRILAGDPHHRDHWDDIAGYATLAADRTAHNEQPSTAIADPVVDARRKAGQDTSKPPQKVPQKARPKRRARR